MRGFARLFDTLDRTRGTNARVAALAAWLGTAPPADAAHAVALLVGRRPKRVIPVRTLAEQVCADADIPPWLFDACYANVGDLAETVSLLLAHRPHDPTADAAPLHTWMEDRIPGLRAADDASRRAMLGEWWPALSSRERFLLVKVLTGAFRVGVSKGLVVRALVAVSRLERAVIEGRLMGDWTPSADWWATLIAEDEGAADLGRPYPFFLASPLPDGPEALGDPDAWIAEWKWDGIRAQILRRGGQTWIWSRGEELLTERFPELSAAAERLPDGTVLDGEILAWRDGPLPFAALQTRIQRKRVGPKALAEAPAVCVVYDLLEADGTDLRASPLTDRRERLATLLADDPVLLPSPTVDGTWAERAAARETSRDRGVEGLMLKRRGSPYRSGRPRGDWWKWKIAPLSIDAVLIYAQKGHGRRAGRYTDYTFGLWRDGALVPVAKAYSGITDAEIELLDRWVRRHTQERFGPVAQVVPTHVFELHFDGVQRSTRHKSGVAVRFPRMARWRRDKAPADADDLAALEALLPRVGG